ncbi:MAG: nucleotidyl transferase AbiEii/AbiGii toxin family protein [Treponematales bacterium]
MLHTDTLEKHALELVKKLLTVPILSETRLAGGTALAMQLGHRLSIDLDLFGNVTIDAAELLESLKRNGMKPVLNYSSANSAQFIIDEVNVDIVRYHYQWLEDCKSEAGLRLAGLKDIAAMKLEAVTNRGTKRDFVDIYFLLKTFSLKQMLKLYSQKYLDSSPFNVLRSLTYFMDAETMPMPKMLLSADWEEIKVVIRNEVKTLK